MTSAAVKRLAESATITRLALAALLAAVLFGMATVRKSDQITNAVPRREFLDTTHAIREDVSTAASRAEAAARQATSVSCYIAKYPAGLCDEFLPRPAQAGSTRPARRQP
jgi:hypothetical protein